MPSGVTCSTISVGHINLCLKICHVDEVICPTFSVRHVNLRQWGTLICAFFYWMHIKSFDSQSQSTGFLNVYHVGILCVDACLFSIIWITNSIVSRTTNTDLQFLARCISSRDQVNYVHCVLWAVSKPRVILWGSSVRGQNFVLMHIEKLELF